jgi:SNF2 family DNA or RNA helicase
MEIVGDKALVIRTRNPQKIIDAIPKSEILKRGEDLSEVAVNWGLDETLVLHNLGYSKAPSPIISRYKWCGIHTPFAHQKETAAFLTTNHRCFVLNEAGTGKTSAAIWAADYLMKKGRVNRVLIIAPLSILSSAWQSDLFKVAMHRTVSVAHGAANKRKQIIKEGSEFVIINYDGVEVVVDEILEGGFDLIIADECTSLKNPSTKRWKTVKKIIKPNTRLWMMTGTPAAQSPLDAYGMAKLVNPEQVPRTFGGWRDMTMQHISQFRWIPKPRAKEIVHAALQPAIRFTKEECLDLPDVIYMTRDVELTPQQKRYYEVLRKEMLFSASGEEVTAVNAATKMGKLLQISGGAVYTDDKQILEFDVSNRMNVLKEVLDETSNKAIVFAPYRHTIELLRVFLEKEGISVELIHGDVSVNKRTDIFNRFQTQSDPKVLVIQPQAASHGVTLTAADNVIFWSPVTSVETYIQCIARMDRFGQKNKMTVTHLQGSEVERKLYKALQDRKNLHEELVALYRGLTSDAVVVK